MSSSQGLFFRHQATDDHHKREEPEERSNESLGTVPFRERIKHFTWAWFTLPMSTGGIALLLAEQPHTFTGLRTIGKIFFIFDLIIYLGLFALITARFTIVPVALRRSLLHPTEGLFFPTFWLATVNVCSGIQLYGVPSSGPWLVVVMRVLFWLYLVFTFAVAVGQYYFLFTGPAKRLTIQSMTPAWVLPIFPVMLCGTFASVINADQPPDQRMAILIAAVTMQGLGFMVSFLMYAVFLHRLIQFGLPAPNLRPGMFIAVGPPSFTGVAFIGLSRSLPAGYGFFEEQPMAIETLQIMATFIAIFLWSLSFWFFCIAMISVLMGVRRMTFHLVWWALVFPNVGFTLATINIGKELQSPAILWLGSVMTILLVVIWTFVLISHTRAVLRKEIMMPGKDEDKDQYKEDDRKHNIPTPP